MKIKMILKYDIESLEEEVNKFIENVEVIDIEYEIVSEPGTFISMHKHIAMIMYEEKIEYLEYPPIEIDWEE